MNLIKPTPKADVSDAKKTSQPSIKEALTTKDSLNCVYARLAAVDRISLKTLESSVDIQEGLRARGYAVLKSREAIKKHTFDFASETRLKMEEIYKEVFSLGLIRVHGSMPAEKAVALVDERLEQFGLNRQKDIVATTTDGAAVMRKFGKIMQIKH